jgi:hypothetical protein
MMRKCPGTGTPSAFGGVDTFVSRVAITSCHDGKRERFELVQRRILETVRRSISFEAGTKPNGRLVKAQRESHQLK